MTKFITSFLSIGLLVTIAGCYPDGIDTFEETDTVFTVKNPTADYSANKTFSIPDQVVDLCDFRPKNPPQEGDVVAPPDCTNNDKIDHSFDSLILQTVKENLTHYGYSEVDPNTVTPDVGIFVAGAKGQIYVQYYYDYWYWYWGWYPGWGGYPGDDWYYPAYPVTVAYDTGTLFITMVKPTATDKHLPVLWNSTINGLLGSDVVTTKSRIKTTINQAFTQSPYLSVK